MSVHSRGLFKRPKRLSFTNPLIDDAATEVTEVTDERTRPITDQGKGISNDSYSKSDSARPQVPSPTKKGKL